MAKQRALGSKLLHAARWLGVALALSLAVGACGAGGLKGTVAKGAFVARIAVTAATHVVTGSSPPAPALPIGSAATASAPSQPAATSGTTASPAAAPKTGSHPQSGGTAAAAAAPAAPSPTNPAAVPVLALRRQPTATELNQAIKAVNNLIPFFTPTAAQIADVGNQVCTDFDHGQTFAQVKAQALNMVGAGSFSWMIPSSVPATAVRTVVNLYCPAYASKLA